MEVSRLNVGEVSDTEALQELHRLLAYPHFKATDRNRAFLQYLADKRLSGQTTGVKAYAVAIDVFGRPSSFDANSDPIVRIEATRLRSTLEQYYENHGASRSVHIRVPSCRDLAPKFYPVLSSLQRFWVAVLGAVAAGCGAEPFRLRSTASRRGLMV